MKSLSRLFLAVVIGVFALSTAATYVNADEPHDSHADALLAALRADAGAGITARAYIVGTSIPNDTSDWRGANYLIWGHELTEMMYGPSETKAFYFPVDFVNDNIHASSLLQQLRANGGAGRISLFNITGKSLPETGLLTGQQIPDLFGFLYLDTTTHSKAWGDPTGFCNDFIHADTLLTQLRANGGAGRIAVFNVMGYSFPATGPLNDTQIGQIFSMMYDGLGATTQAYSDPTAYITDLTHASDLLDALRANGQEGITALSTITGTTLPAFGSLNAAQIGILFGLMYDSGGSHTVAYSNPAAFITAMLHAQDLLAALRTDNCVAVNGITGLGFPASGALNQAQTEALFGFMYDAFGAHTLAYTNAAAFQTFMQAAYNLHISLGTHRAEFEAIYGIAIAAQDPVTNTAYRAKLFDIVGDPAFDQVTFLADMAATYSLHNALASNRNDFATIYGIVVSNQVLSSAAYKQLLSDIVGGIGFDQATYITNLGKAASLHAALATHKAEFAAIYGIPVANQDPAANTAYRAKLFDIVGTIGYDEASFIGGLDETSTLHAALASSRIAFQTIYGMLVVDQQMSNSAYTTLLGQISGAPGYSQAAYVTSLNNAASLDGALDTGSRRAEFETIYGILQADQDPATNTIYRQKLFDIVCGPGYVEATFLTDMNLTTGLHTALASSQNAFSTIFGIAPVDQVFTNATYKQLLSDIVWGAGYDQAGFVTSLGLAASLHNNMTAGNRNAFAGIYGIPVASQDPATNAAYRTLLFDIVGTTGYDEVTFLAGLDLTGALDKALQDNGARPDFETMYGILVAAQLMTNSDYTDILGDITSGVGYSQPAFIAGLAKAADLHAALNADAHRAEFEAIYGILQADQDPVTNAAYTTKLFDIVGTTGYIQADFLTDMTQCVGLHGALSSSRADFETMYGVLAGDQVLTNAIYKGMLSDIVWQTGYSQSAFVTNLGKAADLHAALATHKAEFAAVYNIAEANQDPVTNASYKGQLFNIVGSDLYDQASFITDLVNTVSLHNALSSSRNDFQAMYGITVGNQIMTNAAYKQLLSSIVVNPSYVQAAFIASLGKAASLHAALNSLRTDFAAIYGVATSAQNPATNDVYKQLLFDIVNNPAGYNQAEYVADLASAASLHYHLNGYRYAFEDSYGIAPNQQYPAANASYRTQLFNIVGTAGYDEETTISYFGAVNAILGNNTIQKEADHILNCQYLTAGDGFGAINDTPGLPTWVVPRENAMAILGLMTAYEKTGTANYQTKAQLAADYLVGVQDADGAWFDQYSYATPDVNAGKSPTQTAEVIMALNKLGYDAARYAAVKAGAQYLLACQDVANKTGNDDGLIGAGKDKDGNWQTWRWASDNAYGYQALKAAESWATQNGDTAFATQCATAAARIITGINDYLYISNISSPDFGVWYKAIDASGVAQQTALHEWINYAPAMLDLPVTGVTNVTIGEWIHNKFQQADGSVVWDDGSGSAKKSPGFTFQACLVWMDLGLYDYVHKAMDWAQSSGLWDSINGGWIDWTENGTPAENWQRFIDTSFYGISVLNFGYTFGQGGGGQEIDTYYNNADLYFDLGQWGLFKYSDSSLTALAYADPTSVTVADLTGDGKLDDLVVDFAGAGLNWYNGSIWTNITYSSTESVAIADLNNDNKNEVICDLGQWGLFQYDGNALSALAYADANSVTVANLTGDGKLDDLVVDFVGAGLNWYNGSTWTNITYSSTQSIAIADINNDNKNEVICDLGQWGLFSYDTTTQQLTALAYADANSVTVADLTGDGKLDDLVVDFAGAGLNWYNGSTWTNITYANIDSVAIADINGDNKNEVICDLGQWGLFAYDTTTQQLAALVYADANSVTVADLTGDGKLDDLVVDFAGAGLNWYNGSTWTNITYSNTESVTIADINGDNKNEVICDLGQWGLFSYDTTTQQLSALAYADPASVTAADVNGDGIKELIADFGAGGTQQYTNGVWTTITYALQESLTKGLTTRLSSKTLSTPDLNGNIYYHYKNENWNSQGYGRPDIVKKQNTDSYGNKAYAYTYTTTDIATKTKGYADKDMTQLNEIRTAYDDADHRSESETYMDAIGPGGSLVMASYTRYNDATNHYEEQVLASADQYGFTYYHMMNEAFFDNGTPTDPSDDYGRTGFKISATTQDEGQSFIFSYYAGTSNAHYQYVYSDRLWNTFVKAYEFDETGTLTNTYTTEQDPTGYGATDDENEWSQRAALQAKVQQHGTTSQGGFTFTSAMAGEEAGKNPFNGASL